MRCNQACVPLWTQVLGIPLSHAIAVPTRCVQPLISRVLESRPRICEVTLSVQVYPVSCRVAIPSGLQRVLEGTLLLGGITSRARCQGCNDTPSVVQPANSGGAVQPRRMARS
ncbi:hypothetical protein GGR56DRAFT_542968 [Xylariaceae sp. FL0804]|nr:hypothetical protein GGR56DRAFT_542968 [Xylariaceae sp. FL0804]